MLANEMKVALESNWGVRMDRLFKIQRLINDLDRAQKFLFDGLFVDCANSLVQRPKSFADSITFARLPFDCTWIEFEVMTEDGPLPFGFLLHARDERNLSGDVTTLWMENGAPCISEVGLLYDFTKPRITIEGLVELGVDLESTDLSLLREVLDKPIETSHPNVAAKLLGDNCIYGSSRYYRFNDLDPRAASDISQTMLPIHLRVLALLILLNSKNFANVDSKVIPSPLRRSAAKKGRHLYDHNTVRICAETLQRIYPGGANPSSLAELRAHLVRCHPKKRKTGVHWWSSFVRGNAKGGIVTHDYVIK